MRLRPWLLLVAWLPASAFAHGVWDGHLAERLPLLATAAAIVAAWLGYLLGARRSRSRYGEAFAFHAAMLLMALAMFGPLDRWAETSTSWHMVQHMLFMAVIPPLLVVARPLAQWRVWTGRLIDRPWGMIMRATRYPTAMALLHGAVIWSWHTPELYRLALEHLGWHAFEHACFLLSGWLFWWSTLRASPRQMPPALMAMLLTLMHTGLLGALLTFASVSFYGADRAVEDQQLAGLLMWVPGGLIYLGAAGWICWRWLTRSWRRQGGMAQD